MYKVIATKDFLKSMKKLDKSVQKMIKKYIEANIVNSRNPKAKGKALELDLKGYWRYRIGSYRLICEISDEQVVIILVGVGHRKNTY